MAEKLMIEGFEYEVDAYSVVDGQRTDDFDLAGGSVVLRGSIGGVPARVTMSGANLPQALGQALALLLRQHPPAGTRSMQITAYIDAETGKVAELDRTVT